MEKSHILCSSSIHFFYFRKSLYRGPVTQSAWVRGQQRTEYAPEGDAVGGTSHASKATDIVTVTAVVVEGDSRHTAQPSRVRARHTELPEPTSPRRVNVRGQSRSRANRRTDSQDPTEVRPLSFFAEEEDETQEASV
jgi:hypothetical protein